jgi:hypothetical protein
MAAAVRAVSTFRLLSDFGESAAGFCCGAGVDCAGAGVGCGAGGWACSIAAVANATGSTVEAVDRAIVAGAAGGEWLSGAS